MLLLNELAKAFYLKTNKQKNLTWIKLLAKSPPVRWTAWSWRQRHLVPRILNWRVLRRAVSRLLGPSFLTEDQTPFSSFLSQFTILASAHTFFQRAFNLVQISLWQEPPLGIMGGSFIYLRVTEKNKNHPCLCSRGRRVPFRRFSLNLNGRGSPANATKSKLTTLKIK